MMEMLQHVGVGFCVGIGLIFAVVAFVLALEAIDNALVKYLHWKTRRERMKKYKAQTHETP